MTRSFGFSLLWALLAFVASVPLWYSLPEPQGTLVLREAVHVDGDAVALQPLPVGRLPPGLPLHYRVEFTLDDYDDQYLFIPVLSQRVIVNLNGARISDTLDRTSLAGLASGVPALIPLPAALLRERNVIDLELESSGRIPAYLSPLYIGDAERLVVHYRLRVFVLEYLKLMAFAAQMMITIVVAVAWIYRPADPLFRWLVILLPLSMVSYLGLLREQLPFVDRFTPYGTMLSSAAAMMLVVIALLVAGRRPPRWLCWTTVALPALSITTALLGLVQPTQLALALNAPLNIVGLLACLGIVAWAAVKHNVTEAWFLVLPVALGFVTALRDLFVVFMVIDGPVFLSLYYRPLMLIGFAMILMRRLGMSLIALDDVNQYLKQRLAEQERVLERMHAEERAQAAQRIRMDERQRLTKDLHDGLSGHLVSIIALSERENAREIEHSAREALDDLRLVIHSLDIGEDELPLALAGLRERLERQLKRIDIGLSWSVVNLPDIPGLTPTHALNILRILQEAITNAVKHAQARRIAVYGSTDVFGRGVLTIENDGLPFNAPAAGDGHGLANMRRRVARLGGELIIEPLAHGTRLAVVLPTRLPAVK